MLCEMQSISSRIWTRVVVSISYDDNHYTMGTSNFILLMSYFVIRYDQLRLWLRLAMFLKFDKKTNVIDIKQIV